MTEKTAAFPLYSRHGVRTSFTVVYVNVSEVDAEIDRALAAGYTVNVAGAEPGETVEDVGYVSRRVMTNGTSRIDLFSPNTLLGHKVFTLYLDTPDMIAEFEQQTGLIVDRLPVFEGDAAIKKTSPTWGKYGVAVKRAAKVALKDNPKHDPAETDVSKKKPKHLFARWLPSSEPAPQPAPAPPLAEVPRPKAEPAASSSGSGDTARAASASDSDPALDNAFGKREPNTIVVSEVRVGKTATGGRVLTFAAGDVKVLSFTRDPLRNVYDDSLLEQLAVIGVHPIPPVRLTYIPDGKFLKLEKAELVA